MTGLSNWWDELTSYVRWLEGVSKQNNETFGLLWDDAPLCGQDTQGRQVWLQVPHLHLDDCMLIHGAPNVVSVGYRDSRVTITIPTGPTTPDQRFGCVPTGSIKE